MSATALRVVPDPAPACAAKSVLPDESAEATCASVASINGLMADLYERIGELARQRDVLFGRLFETTGNAMLERGQQSKTIRFDGRTFVIKVGRANVLICACHGAHLGQCSGPESAEPGEVVKDAVVALSAQPYIKVRETTDTSTDGSAA